MKKLIICFLFLLSLSLIAATGTAPSYNDSITVDVKIENGKIIDIKILELNDPERIAIPAIEKLKEEIIKTQNIDVDNIAGATFTSIGYKQAIHNAIDD